tara:strand:+ start:14844 stop:15062 length:219 start_codon:yes stop_codon:yes gene_type:complete
MIMTTKLVGFDVYKTFSGMADQIQRELIQLETSGETTTANYHEKVGYQKAMRQAALTVLTTLDNDALFGFNK